MYRLTTICSCLGAALCMSGACFFVAEFSKATRQCIQLLYEIFAIKSDDTNYLIDYRVNYTIVAAITIAITLMVVLNQYLRTDAQTAKHPIYQFCKGPIPMVAVSAAVRNSIASENLHFCFAVHALTINAGSRMDLCIFQSGTSVSYVLPILQGVQYRKHYNQIY